MKYDPFAGMNLESKEDLWLLAKQGFPAHILKIDDPQKRKAEALAWFEMINWFERIKRNGGRRDLGGYSKTATPPILGEFLVCVVVPRTKQADRFGDLEEIFTDLWVPKFGPTWARVLYFVQVASIWKSTIRGAVLDKIVKAITSFS
jgi:hypothetical protein